MTPVRLKPNSQIFQGLVPSFDIAIPNSYRSRTTSGHQPSAENRNPEGRKYAKNWKAAGPDGIPAEALKMDLETSADDSTTGEGVERKQGTCGLLERLLIQTTKERGLRSGSIVYRELCTLAQQIGRPDLALSLIVLAIALPVPSRNSNTAANTQSGSCFSNIVFNLSSSVTYSSLVRRLGRSLASALPRLVPRIYVRRFDFARPKLRQAMENVWLGLVLYATNSATPLLSSNLISSNININVPSTTTSSPTNQNTPVSSSPAPNS
ncbi:unnamed protein product, partial [Trichobilharzia regenti]